MVKLTKIYTRGGDKGLTSLGDGTRLEKYHPRVAAYGAVDELNATIGIIRLHLTGDDDRLLAAMQNDLFDLGADLCTPHAETYKWPPLRVTADQVTRLEQEIDRLNGDLAPLDSFILPGGSPAAAHLHLARVTARRAEREVCRLADQEEINQEALKYLNRLSDLLFVMARWVNDKGAKDVLWVPGANRD